MPKHVGIVGVSAEGAALCYKTFCVEGAARLGRHGHPEVTMHTLPLASYMPPIESGDWSAVGELLLSSVAKLRGAGVELLICPDNTVHPAIDLIRDRASLPWLHIAEEVAKVAVERGFKRVLVLGTRYLMESSVYPERLASRGIQAEIPARGDRERINALTLDELVYGQFKESTRAYFTSVIADGQRRGCEAVALACTEFPLLVREEDSPIPTLDSTRILARAALREAVR